jgi:hypothetical protein
MSYYGSSTSRSAIDGQQHAQGGGAGACACMLQCCIAGRRAAAAGRGGRAYAAQLGQLVAA